MDRARGWLCALVVAVLAGCLTVAVDARPAAAAPPCGRPNQPGQVIQPVSWHQRWFSPERVLPFSTGGGVRVAVVDSGVDGAHPQLRQRVLPGFDALHNAPGADVDCHGHGTAVASIIGAQRADGVGFAGLAPGVQILPVRISESEVDSTGQTQGASVSVALFAQSIKWAVDNGARVVNLSVVVYVPDQALKDAVDYARSKDVVLVAAAGNEHKNGERPDPIPFPAAYEGVIGVGAVDERGVRDSKSQVGPYVDLVAPGVGVTAATRQFGHQAWTGTSFATPMVTAAAALLRAAEPRLTADQVAQRLIATADPGRGGRYSEGYGHGVVNPYRAVTERLNSAPPVAAQPLPDRPYDPAAVARASRWRTVSTIAAGAAGVAGLLVLAVLAAAAVLPRGRRRKWRPGRPPPAVAAATGAPDRTDRSGEPEDDFFALPR